MWLFTRHGFYSITQTPSWNSPAFAGELQVRARAREDLEALKRLHNLTQPIIESANTDYPFRLFIDPERMAEVVAAEVLAVNYVNFKNTITDDTRHSAYLRVWSALLALMPARFRKAAEVTVGPKNGKTGGIAPHNLPPAGWHREVYGGGKPNPGLFTDEELAAMNRDGVTGYDPRQRRKRKGGR